MYKKSVKKNYESRREGMKKVIEKRIIRGEIGVLKKKKKKNRFGFMPEKSTTEPIFCMRQVLEKYTEKKRKPFTVYLYFYYLYKKIKVV